MKNKRKISLLTLVTVMATLVGCGGGNTSHPDDGARPPSTAEAFAAAHPDPDTDEFRTAKKNAHRFLEQASFGPTLEDMSYVAQMGQQVWIDEQLLLAPTLMLPELRRRGDQRWNEFVNIWFKTALTAEDQLRQRVAFALSQIFVVSATNGLGDEQYGLANYYDILVRSAFGNFRDLLQEVTLSPVMGEYLSMKGNHKPDPEQNLRPDENYARELLQLFTIGLVQLNNDGSVIQGPDGVPLASYDQDVVEGFAHVFTGWHFANADHFRWPSVTDYLSPMLAWEEYHDKGKKKLLNGVVLEAGKSAIEDLNAALDNIFAHPNVGPFIARQLIQRLVTSNPSARYIADVAAVFNADESGIRGSLASVVKAILLHDEARHGHLTQPETFGKLKEPLLRITGLWRAFMPTRLSPEFNYAWAQNDIDQSPLNSPSVFNFFTPHFSQPGEIRNRGLVSPEFQILDESSIIKLTNRLLANSLWSHNYKYESDTHRWALNITPEVELIERDAAAFLDQLDLLLLGGDMSAELRQIATQLIASFNSETQIPDQVIETIFLIASSPEAAIQI